MKYPVSHLPVDQGYYYLATPYSKWTHGIHDANIVAQKMAGELIKVGVPVYSPIAHTHGIALAANIDPFSHAIFMPADKPLFEGAFGLLIADLNGWRESKGVAIEIGWAKELKKPIWVISPGMLDVRPFKG